MCVVMTTGNVTINPAWHVKINGSRNIKQECGHARTHARTHAHTHTHTRFLVNDFRTKVIARPFCVVFLALRGYVMVGPEQLSSNNSQDR